MPRRNVKGRTFARTLFLLIGLLPLAAGLVLGVRAFRFQAFGVPAEAQVIDRVVRGERGNRVHLLFLQFKDLAGTDRVARAEVIGSLYESTRLLSTCEVLYLPADPDGARLAATLDLALPALLVAVAAFFFLAARLVGLATGAVTPPPDPVPPIP